MSIIATHQDNSNIIVQEAFIVQEEVGVRKLLQLHYLKYTGDDILPAGLIELIRNAIPPLANKNLKAYHVDPEEMLTEDTMSPANRLVITDMRFMILEAPVLP